MFFSYWRFAILRAVFLSLVCTCFASDAPLTWTAPHFSIGPKVLYAEASETAPEGTNVTILDDEQSYSFYSPGRSLYTSYLVYKVLTQQGAEGWSSISVWWEPWHQERPVIKVRVITPDLVVHDLDLKTLTDAPARDEDEDLYSDRRVVRGPLPAIAPGSVVEQEVVINERTPMFEAGTVRTHLFGEVSVPVRHSSVTVEVPSSVSLRYAMQLFPGLQPQRTENAGRTRLVFERGPMTAMEKPEPNLPSDVPAYPSVSFSTGASWQKVAGEYAAIVESHLAAADLKPLVEKLTAGKQTRDEKAQAMLQYLDKEIRYTGIEFDESVIVPHSPDETLIHKYGDCKDKATLLVALLRTAGIPAYIALLNAGGRMDVPSDLPGMGLFDHAIVYAPGTPDFWIDATDDYARLGQLPTRDQGRRALVIRPESTELVRTPEESSQDNVLLEFREINLADHGPARIIERSQPHGSGESSYRRSYADKQDKATRDDLTNYVKSQYLAEKLDRLDRSDPDDLSHQFELVLESDRAKRGFTDLELGVAAIRLDGLFYRLPAELRQREKPGQEPKAKRSADYQLPEAFATEWRYTIAPPAGFQPKPLPNNVELQLGPCVLTEQFALGKDNTVRATLRFDTLKRRLSVTEAAELRDKIVQLVEAQPILIYFDPTGQALVNEGKARAGLQSYRGLIALHPKEAVHHLRMAELLLSVGLAEAARVEARLAVKLEPNSPLAEKTLADILEYDVVGRKLRAGSDYAGAETAFRAAEKLDPEDKEIIAKLALLLEYNRWGVRYGPGARLTEAAAEYRKLSAEQQADLGIQNNVAFALFYAGEFSEAKKAGQALNSPPTGLIVACEAALNGSAAGLADARKRTAGEEQFKEVASTAGAMLEKRRQYSLAADFKEAGAAGANASDLQAEASLLRKTQLHEQLQLADDPSGVALRFVLLVDDPDLTLEQLRSISSRNGTATLVLPEVRDDYAKQQRKTIYGKARAGESADIGIDLSIARAEPRVEGNDASGYKVTLWSSASYKQSIYIVKEDGHYRVLATSAYPAGIGLEVLDRIAANDLTGARALLDWLREDQHLKGGDDPLDGGPFPRFWTKGKEADAGKMKLAAAAILVMTKSTAARGITVLESAHDSAVGEVDRGNIALALDYGYESLHEYEKELTITAELVKQYPESVSAFRWYAFCLRALGRLDESDELARQRLRRIPGDAVAVSQFVSNAKTRGDFVKAHDLSQEIVQNGNASYLNDIAWYSLFIGKPKDSDVDAALKAAQLSQNYWGYLHTLGCLYAELGKLREARDVLVQAMDLANFSGPEDEPEANFWFAFGRIAEQAGEREAARADYTRVRAPKNPNELPQSSYHLAQIRLKAMQKPVD